jgi:ubiquinone/menaquinone biosynthesis C-methylase UbiE
LAPFASDRRYEKETAAAKVVTESANLDKADKRLTLQVPDYSQFTNNPIYRAATDHLVDLAGSANGQTVIDLACGTGACSACLLERYTPAELILVDPDKDALLHAQELCSVPSRTFCTFAEQLASVIPKNSADIVIVGNALHLFSDIGAAARGILHCLRPGGVVVLSTAFHVDAAGDDEHAFIRLVFVEALRTLRGTPKASREKSSRDSSARTHLRAAEIETSLTDAGLVGIEISERGFLLDGEFYAGFVATTEFASAALPGYPPALAAEALSRGALRVAGAHPSGGVFERRWLYTRAFVPVDNGDGNAKRSGLPGR